MSEKNERSAPPLARLGIRLSELCERWFPDAFVFALMAALLVFLLGLFVGESPRRLTEKFGGDFWELSSFTIQMVMVIIGGFVVATSPPVMRVVRAIAAIPRSSRGAVAFVAAFAMLTSMISWGFSLIVTGLLVRAIVQRRDDVDFRAISSAAYLGLGSVWALGLSSSAALLQASKTLLPASLLPVTGIIPLRETIFLPQSLLMAAILIIVSITVAYFSAPTGAAVKSAASLGVEFREEMIESKPAVTPAEKLEQSPLLMLIVSAALFVHLAGRIIEKGFLEAFSVNNLNLLFLAFGLALHWRPRNFLRAVADAVPASTGVLIQFPLYAGIAGMIGKTSLATTLEHWFAAVTNHSTFIPVVALYSALLGFFVPSGGGKWVLEAPYVIGAAKQLHVHLGWTLQTYNAAEALPNLINPFWMLPLMGILRVKARDLAGYSILQLLFHLPLVLFLCWALNLSL